MYSRVLKTAILKTVVFPLIPMYWRILALFLLIVLLSGIAFAVPINLTISINGGANYSDNESVALTLSALNTTGSTNCSYANIVTDWSSPESYSTSRTWDMSLGDGLKTVYYRCTNDGENYSEVVSDQIILDASFPGIASLDPANNSVETNPGTAISAVLSDGGSGIDSSLTEFKFDGSAVSETFDSGTGKVSYQPSSDLSEGAHYAEVTAFDKVGHSTYARWDFTVDKLPKISKVYPDEGSYPKSTSFTIYADISDSGSGIDLVESRMEVDAEGVDETVSSSKIEYSASLDEGKHEVEVFIYDKSGNLARKSWNFTIDKTDPVVGDFSPGDGSTVGLVNTISARVSDTYSGIKESTVLMKVDGIDVTEGTDYSSKILSFPIGGMNGGEHSVEIWVEDNAGNTGFGYWTFTVSSKDPLISEITPPEGSSTSNTKPVISAKVTDQSSSGLNMNSLKISLDGADKTSDAEYDNSKRTISYIPESGLSEGSHTVKVQVSDKIGNDAERSWKFNVDTSGAPAPGNLKITVSGSSATLEWDSVADAAKYRIYKSSSKISSVSGLNPLSTLTKTTYTDSAAGGKQYYAVTAVDSADNEGSPAFAGTCAQYSGGWKDYACCADTDCGSAKCNMTSHTCYYPSVDTSRIKAEEAIDEANASIYSAKDEGKNVSEAQDLLDQALNSFNIGNYAQAQDLADQAELKLESAPLLNQTGNGEQDTGDGKKPLPCCPSAFILLGIVGVGLYYREKR